MIIPYKSFTKSFPITKVAETEHETYRIVTAQVEDDGGVRA